VTVPSTEEQRRRLVGERERTRLQIESLQRTFDSFVEASEDVATDDEHDPEGHTIAFERQQVAALLRDAVVLLGRLDGAFEQLDRGDYGSCMSCGGPIGSERLEALPATQTCISCAV